MKVYIALFIIFCSFVVLSYSGLFQYDLLGGTQLNGNGCVCHTVERDTSVAVWVEGPDTLFAGETGIYKMFLAKGPAQGGGYNVAGMFGTMVLVDSFSYWHYLSPNELTQAFPLVFPTPNDTIYWEFGYKAPDSVLIDTIYSCGLSLVYDSIPDWRDRWNFGEKFPIVVIENPLPVELKSFTAAIKESNVILNWITSSETNNYGFEIERNTPLSLLSRGESDGAGVWKSIGFVNGKGTTTKTHSYSFTDKNLDPGKYQYRLKQIDYDGKFKISQTVEAEISTPNNFVLEQNFPNPFSAKGVSASGGNPATKIKYTIGSPQFVQLKVYDVLGNEVATLVNEEKLAGSYEVNFSPTAINLPASSGVYFYQLKAGNFTETKKMVLIR